MDFNLIERAGLTQLEFSRVVGYSRPSVNLWRNGRKAPGPVATAKLARAAAALRAAIKDKDLPAPEGAERNETLALLAEIVNATETA